MSRKAKKAMAVALTAGMLASTAVTPVMAATQGWKQNSKGWWYQNADGTYPANKWSQINGKWYYFDANGYMLANKWVKDKAGKWYYVGANGAMKTNSWAKDSNGLWYWLTGNGSMFEGGWARINGEWYFFKNDGVMQSGVVKVDGETYYLGAPEQGWMQTGTFSIAGTEYNFDAKTGACTSEKAPAADKFFDKKGKEVTPTIDIEEVAGITGGITNALPDYKEKYGNVLIAGRDAYLKVLVTDNNGKPVANTAVSLTTKAIQGDLDEFDTKGLSVQTTDANGYATFVIGAKKSKITATNGYKALLSLTATVVATNQTYDTTLAFATVKANTVNVLNDDPNVDLVENPSTNASVKDNSVTDTCSTDGNIYTEYVFSQQVNDIGSDANRVEIEIDPIIEIPVKATDVVSDYYQEINKEVKEYTVYEDGSDTSLTIDDIPDGLRYVTINFTTADVSKYTQVKFEVYNKITDKLLKTYTKEGPWTQKNFGYDIPVQEYGTDIYVVVKVVSEGQVNDDQNSGILVKDIEGLYAVKDNSNVEVEHLTNCVKWSTVQNRYSDERTLDAETAKAYIGTQGQKYIADGNKYTYQVPVFPYTGNAIMTVTNNGKVVGYFAIPTTNTYNTTKQEWNNVNELDPYARAILISKAEAFNNVGTISTEGNKVIVNSDQTGITALQAKIELPGFEDEIDLTNNTAYTSVQWAPVLNVAESNEFYALVGQNVTIKAQLVDSQGNPVSGNQDAITFNYIEDNEAGIVPGKGDKIGTTKVTVVDKDTNADENGQAFLKLTSGDELALLQSLEATTSKYDVVLSIGDEKVEMADLRWVKPGLAFTTAPKNTYDKYGKPAVNEDYVKVDTLSNPISELTTPDKAKLESALAKSTNENWILGYEVVGITKDQETDETAKRDVLAIEGLKVNLANSNEFGEMKTEGMANGTAKLTSDKKGGTKFKGTINKDSYSAGTDVILYVDVNNNGKIDDDEKFKSVGEDAPSIDTSLELPITWGIVSEQLTLVSPKGSNFVVNSGDKVYVKLASAFDEAIGDKPVKITVTYTMKDGTVEYATALNTGAKSTTKPALELSDETSTKYGLVPITLSDDANIKYVTITATYDENVKLTSDNVITYKDATNKASNSDFALVNAVYSRPDLTKAATVELTFSNSIDKGSFNAEMFTISASDDSKTFAIDKVEVNDKKVKITLDNVNPTLENDGVYKVTVNDSKVVNDITYSLCDTDGRSLKATGAIGSDAKAVLFTTASRANEQSQTGMTITINPSDYKDITAVAANAATGAKYVVVYSGTTGLVDGATNGIYISTNGTFDLVAGKIADGDITVYYNGASKTITKDEINDKIKAKQQADLNDSTAVDAVTAVGADTTVSFGDVTGCYISNIKVVEAKPATPIFATPVKDTNGVYSVKTATTLPADGTTTAVVTVTYTSGDFADVKREVVYDVTLSSSQSTFAKR